MKKRSSDLSAKILVIILALFIIVLCANVFYLSVTGKHLASHSDILAFSESIGGGQKVETLYAKRGTIYSSDGEIIASDVKKYKLIAILSDTRVTINNEPAYVVDKEATAKALAEILKGDYNTILKRLSHETAYQVELGSIGNNLSSLIRDKILELDLPGLEFEEMTSRNYRYGNFASYLIGYAKVDNEKDTKKIVGQMGLELTYDKTLSGSHGKKVYLVSSNQIILPNGVLSEEAAQPGNDLHLTIDTDIQTELDRQLQNVAEQMKIDKGTCAIMEAKTGRILAVSNFPSFDPNDRDIVNYIDLFFDEAVEPGSVMKAFVYANAINDGKLDTSKVYTSGKYEYKVNGKTIHTIRDHNTVGWGNISYQQGFYNSSNTAICYILTQMTNKESLLHDYKSLGFFKSSTIDSISSAAGVAGYEGTGNKDLEYITTGYGQGSTVTALQLLRATSVFANGGKTVEPTVIDKIVDGTTGETVYESVPQYSAQIFSESAVNEMKDLLDGVVNIKGSTGYTFHMDDIRLIGKTGTGQVASSQGGYQTNYYTRSFIGLAPYDDPEIIIAYWYQNGIAGNKVASEMVSAVVRTAINKLNLTDVQQVENKSYELDSYLNQGLQHVTQLLTQHQLSIIQIGNGTTVIDQYPKMTTLVPISSRVFVKTNGTEIIMPSMDGWSRKEVEAFASLAGIKIEFDGIGNVYSQSVAKGIVLDESMTIQVKAK